MTLGRRLFLRALVASLSATAALAIGTLLFADFEDTAARTIATTGFLSVASVLALPAGVLLDRRRAPLLAWAVIAATTTAFALVEVALWRDVDSERLWKLALTFALAALAGAQAAATTSWRSSDERPALTWLYWISIVLTVAMATLIAAAAWRESDAEEGARLMAALAVAALLTTVLQPILRRLQPPAVHAHELVLRLDRRPSEAAVEEARQALERHGVRVESIVGPRD